MANATYQKNLEKHLAEYRLHRLGVEKKGTFKFNGKDKQYGHILPKELKWLNILEPFRKEAQMYADTHKTFKPHIYFHHLNSSQAFALNLFWPFQLQSPEALQRAFDCESVTNLKLEHVVDGVEGTNVDVSWMSGAVAIHCEVKLSENEFGKGANDPAHVKKLDRIYRPILTGQMSETLLEPVRFFKFYQVYRNLWLAARDRHDQDQIRFLLPRANTRLVALLNQSLDGVGASLRGRVRIIFIEDLLATLSSDATLGRYARLLQEKYVID
jgi:hypothetical protein